MTPEQWRRLDDALAAALELEPSERAAALRQSLGDDPAALLEAEQLLAAESAADQFFQATPAGGGALFPRAALGPWRLVRELGRGGMGVVWLAERADGQAEMCAAIKFLDGPFVSPESRRRFASEKRLLARLNHPNIARLLDPGLDHAGPPNFILEYVDGLPLTRFTENQPLSVRLRLLIQIAGAVHHAHGNLVIHRDLKPSNILVTPAGESKLLDFGIARLSQESSTLTRTLFRALSLDYASPEQIRGEEVSTAADIYSLGLLYWEVLTGRRARDWSAMPIAEAIREAGHFHLPAEPSLHPDLRAILDKATEFEPARRYASAAALAEDLERFQQSRPVEARPRTALYSLQRFVARNRWPVAAAAVAVVAVAALATAAVLAGLRAEASHQVADARLRQVEAANAETRRALQDAQAQRAHAESQSRLASARLQDVEEMSFSLLNDTYQELQELPGATAVRARLIEKTLSRLQRLRAAESGNRDLLLLIADSHGRLAAELGGSNENLGNLEAALRHLRVQFETLDSLRRGNPGDVTVTRLWADARAFLWFAEKRLNRKPDSRVLTGLHAIWTALLAQAPRDIAVLRSAGSYYFRCALGLGLDLPSQVLYLEKARALWAAEEAVSGGGENVWRNLALAHKYLAGTIARDKPSPLQLEHAEKARAYDQKRLDRNPANAQARMDLTFDITSVADYHVNIAKNYAEAARLYREALRIRQVLHEFEPANTWYRRSLLYPARFAAYAAAAANDFDALAADVAALRQSIERAGSAVTAVDRVSVEMYSGDLALHLNRPAEACAAWSRASRHGPASEELRTRLAGCPPSGR